MKLVILDRDGTLNVDRDDFVKSADEWEPLPGALEAVARLNQGGWRVVVATNQSGVGRGLFGMEELNAMHAKMHRMLADAGARVDAVFFCPHAPQDACDCRKPAPGLFTQIAERYGADMHQVHAVGDSLRDAQAALAAGCTAHQVLTGKAHKGTPDGLPPEVAVHTDLAAFADSLLSLDSAWQPSLMGADA